MQIGNINLIKHKQVSRLKTAWTQTHGTNDYRREWEQLNGLLAHGDSRLVLVVAPVGLILNPTTGWTEPRSG